MMPNQDASLFTWLEGAPHLDLVVTMDDATSEIYSALLVLRFAGRAGTAPGELLKSDASS